MREEDLPCLTGHALPGGHYRITAPENEAFCAAVGCTPDRDGRAHPLYYYIAGQCAMGISVSELLALCKFDVNDGPMMIGSEVTFAQDLWVDREYAVSGSIISVVRKPSRAFGFADTLKFGLTLTDADGAVSSSAVNSWLLPRRGMA